MKRLSINCAKKSEKCNLFFFFLNEGFFFVQHPMARNSPPTTDTYVFIFIYVYLHQAVKNVIDFSLWDISSLKNPSDI